MAILLLLGFLVLPAAGWAQPVPACGAAGNGATACLAGKLCRCGFESGGSLSGQAGGWRWDCGALRPGCGAAEPPAALPGTEAPLPLIIRPDGMPRPWR